MSNKKLYKVIIAALFAAIICVATMVIPIPSPMNGYINLGDCFVLLSGWLLGPLYGFCAAAIGSTLADVFSGYVLYAPATFFIKGLVAVIGAVLYRILFKVISKHLIIARIISGIAGETFMIIGYFGYACLLLGKGLAAAADIPGNIFQGLIGVIASVLLMAMFDKTDLVKKWF